MSIAHSPGRGRHDVCFAKRHGREGLSSEAERAVRVVFAQLQRLLGSPDGLEGEAWDIYSRLPKDLKTLWLEAAG